MLFLLHGGGGGGGGEGGMVSHMQQVLAAHFSTVLLNTILTSENILVLAAGSWGSVVGM